MRTHWWQGKSRLLKWIGENVTLREGSKKLLQKKEFTVIALTAVLFVLLSASSDIFLDPYNLDSLQTSVAPNAIIATGMMILSLPEYLIFQ